MIRILVVWLHVLAAAVWVGGLLYGSHLLLPALARGECACAGMLLRARPVAWVAVGLLVLTGLENVRHVRLESPWLIAKVLLVLVLVPLAAHRDFALLPQAARAIARGDAPGAALASVRGIDRVVAVAAVIVLFLGVAVARGR
jgi:copper resistance protein D